MARRNSGLRVQSLGKSGHGFSEVFRAARLRKDSVSKTRRGEPLGSKLSCNDMTKDVLLQVRLSRADRDRLKAECKRRGAVPSHVVRDLLHGWFNGEDRTALQLSGQRERPIVPKEESRSGKIGQVEQSPIAGAAAKEEGSGDEFSWKKPCPACQGRWTYSSPCYTCGNLGYVIE